MYSKNIGMALVVALSLPCETTSFDLRNGTDGLAVYWGQNSLAIQTNGAQNELGLSQYCTMPTPPTTILLSFHNIFTQDPQINLSNHCQKTFRSSQMLDCTQLAAQIKGCQQKGIQILLSMGGASGAYSMENPDYAQTVFNTYLGGTNSSVQRPFGTAVLDGVDLDIEGGSPAGYANFTNMLHEISPDSVITSAPQCPYPDAMLGDALNNGWFDAVFVQFYNNACSPDKSGFNFNQWADWAKTKSKNPNVKLYIGSPACEECASSGYLGAQTLEQTYQKTKTQYSDVLGGIMLWDAGAAYNGNGPIAEAVAQKALGKRDEQPDYRGAAGAVGKRDEQPDYRGAAGAMGKRGEQPDYRGAAGAVGKRDEQPDYRGAAATLGKRRHPKHPNYPADDLHEVDNAPVSAREITRRNGKLRL
ncbi:Chitinase 2 [Coemansia spiralis]|uniref:chitinase n=2 Tax=Coemansia TaxID=4863 RepID=A0A9W8G5C4_9FUNG|nr:glycoside hydrolase superfamily [Coemansia spiralis]KAJ1987881.1 Chitinase 2 [Coemansia umbellata]KAJ2620485.1 Chitinase 2 [Coemansia sp. RSA 1358]KAJ2675014.1 Chitinase 2 [Coemansia spiralis]